MVLFGPCDHRTRYEIHNRPTNLSIYIFKIRLQIVTELHRFIFLREFAARLQPVSGRIQWIAKIVYIK